MFDGEVGNIVANVNKNNAYIFGTTFEIKAAINANVTFKSDFTYTKGKAYDTGEPLSSIPPLFGNLSLNYSKPRYEVRFFTRFNGRKKLKNYNLSEGIDNIKQTPFITDIGEYQGTPAWMTFNFYLKRKINKKWAFDFAVNNILDQHYKEFASSISAPGRNFTFSLVGTM